MPMSMNALASELKRLRTVLDTSQRSIKFNLWEKAATELADIVFNQDMRNITPAM